MNRTLRGNEQTANSFHEISSCSRQGGFRCAPPALFQGGQRHGVFMRVATQRNRQIVAAMFAFGTDHSGDPPHHRVIKQQALHACLEHVDQIVATADMRQLMQQDGFDLRGGQAREQAHRHKNHGTHVPHHDRNCGQAGFEQPNRPREPEPAAPTHSTVPARNPERNRRPSGADAASAPS